MVSASVLSADMLSLKEEIKRMEKSGIEMLHFDVMDGVFVNNITYGLPILEQVRKTTDLILDVHLMITDPLRYVRRFAECGADYISFHIESESDTAETIRAIREAGAKTALAIKPATPAETVFEYLDQLDMVLVMTVEPGFGGQSFMSDMCDKIVTLRKKLDETGKTTDIQVDGGINEETVCLVAKAGANVIVAGSSVFNSDSYEKAISSLRSNAEINAL